MPREELSAAAAAAIGMVAFKEGDALIFANKSGAGVPETLIVLIEESEKLPAVEIDIDSVGAVDCEFDILDVRDEDGVGVLPGEGEIVTLDVCVALVVCVALIEGENDWVGFIVTLLERVCDILDDMDIVPLTDTLGKGLFELVCIVVDVNDSDRLLDRVVEPLVDDDIDIDSDDEVVADELAV